MKNLIIRQDIQQQSGLTMGYTLFSAPSHRNTKGYGITVTDWTTGMQATVGDISESVTTTLQLFERLLQGFVTPVTMRDVIEDFVAEC